MALLERLAGDQRHFGEQVWGRRVHQHAPGAALAELLSLDDVDHLLTSTGIRAPAVRLVKDGEVVPSAQWTRRASLAGRRITGLVDVRKVTDLVASGATLVLQGLQRYWPPLARGLSDLEASLGHPCQANAYLTPPDARGFDPHADRHDVFVCQTHGSKDWTLHDTEPARTIVLEAGTCLYLPAGTTHAAASRDEVSLHVTIGVKATPWRDLLQRAVDDVLDDIAPTVQQHGPRLPVDPTGNRDATVDQARHHLDLVAKALSDVDAGRLVDDHAIRFATSRTVTWPGMLSDRLGLDGVDDDTMVRRRTNVMAGIDHDEERVHLLLGDRRLSMPGWVAPALELLVRLDGFRPRDLAAELDEESRVVLVRRLVREGLLTLSS